MTNSPPHLDVLTEQGKEIFPKLAAFSGFYLAGGTALALHIGRRVSVDFYLFSSDAITKDLLTRVTNTFSDNVVNATVSSSDELTVLIDNTNVTFLRYPFPPLLPLVTYDTVPILSIQEIAAVKAYTIGRRGEYKDYIDLYFLFQDEHVSFADTIALARKKYGEAFNDRLFLEQLTYLEDVADMPVEFLGPEISRSEIKQFFTDQTKQYLSFLDE